MGSDKDNIIKVGSEVGWRAIIISEDIKEQKGQGVDGLSKRIPGIRMMTRFMQGRMTVNQMVRLSIRGKRGNKENSR